MKSRWNRKAYLVADGNSRELFPKVLYSLPGQLLIATDANHLTGTQAAGKATSWYHVVHKCNGKLASPVEHISVPPGCSEQLAGALQDHC